MAEFFAASKYPQQVSKDQDNIERSEIAFSNGTSFPSSISRSPQITGPLNASEVIKNGQLVKSNTYSTETQRISKRPTAPPRHADYVDYDKRLRSFARWTRSNPGPKCLSEAGFFYTNQCDLVRCFQCGIGLKDFTEGDDPLLEHVRYSGECNYLPEYLGNARLYAIKKKCQEQDQERTGELRNSPQSCRHQEFKTYEARLLSFKNWPSHLSQKQETLADAGLFYICVEDHVRCFMCDGGLRRWDIDDDPWTEHCRWFPGCAYARQKKGDEFIALVKASAAFNAEANGNASGTEGGQNEGLLTTMERLTLRDPGIRRLLDEHKKVCLDIGYDVAEFDEVVEELRNMGTTKPTIEEVLDTIEIVKERRKYQQTATDLEQSNQENPLEENKRLKSLVTCMNCRKNKINALFLPCTHHRLCMECSEQINQCPVCNRLIKQKVKTYLV